MIAEGTILFEFEARGATPLGVCGAVKCLWGLLDVVAGFFDAFLILAQAVGVDLIIFIEGESFGLCGFVGGGQKIFGVLNVFAPDGGFDHGAVQQFYQSKLGNTQVQYIIMINQELYLEVKNKWKSVYPIYFDASKTIQEGRRLPLDQCIKNPTLEEVTRAVCACQLRNIIEPHKSYSRDYFQMGRLKVQLLLESGKPVHINIPNKKKMLQNIGKWLRDLRAKK